MNKSYFQFGNISRSLNNQISDKSNYVTSNIFLLKFKMLFGSQIMLESIIISLTQICQIHAGQVLLLQKDGRTKN